MEYIRESRKTPTRLKGGVGAETTPQEIGVGSYFANTGPVRPLPQPDSVFQGRTPRGDWQIRDANMGFPAQGSYENQLSVHPPILTVGQTVAHGPGFVTAQV